MAQIPDNDQDWLLHEWLPRVRDLVRRRRPIRRLMIGLLLLGVAVCLMSIIAALFTPEHLVVLSGLVTLFLGFSSICFHYIAMLQAFDDQLLVIELAVKKGDWDDLLIAAKLLGGYSKLGRIIADVFRLSSNVRDSSDH